MSAYLFTSNVTDLIVPGAPQPDMAVAPNFERFDGLSQPPLDNPAGQPGVTGSASRPGGWVTPDEYTPGVISGVVGTVGGQPLPVADWQTSTAHQQQATYTPSRTPSVQFRLGDGQANQGVAQTVQLSEITNNPPVPGDLTSILAGLA